MSTKIHVHVHMYMYCIKSALLKGRERKRSNAPVVWAKYAKIDFFPTQLVRYLECAPQWLLFRVAPTSVSYGD